MVLLPIEQGPLEEAQFDLTEWCNRVREFIDISCHNLAVIMLNTNPL